MRDVDLFVGVASVGNDPTWADGGPQARFRNYWNDYGFGEAVDIRPGEEPVFWACGVTPQAVAIAAGVEFMITHAPGHMFVTDLLDEDLAAG